jgi:hypothetical protein
MPAYGSNFGKTLTIRSRRFAPYPTDMNNGAAVLPYEGKGIEPDRFLQGNRDWMEQVKEMIKN